MMTDHLSGLGEVAGVNSEIGDIGNAFTYAQYHREDGDLAFMSYHYKWAAKIWYVLPPEVCNKLKEIAPEMLLKTTFLNGYRRKACQILASKTFFFNQSLFNEKHFPILARRIVQTEGTFVILPPRAYHGVINFGFNI